MSTNTPGLPNSPGQDFDFQKWAAAELKSLQAQAAKETKASEQKLEKWEKAHSCDIHDHEHQADPPKKKKHRSLREKIKHFFKKVGQGIKNAFKVIGQTLLTLAKQMLSMLPMLLTGPLGMIMGLGSMLMNAIAAIKAKAMLSKYMKESAAQTEQLKSMEKSLESQLSNYIKEATQSSKSTSSKSTNSDIV